MPSGTTERYSVPFSPLEDRIAYEDPQLVAGLVKLRDLIGKSDFETYINSLVSLRKVNNQLLIITKREMYRSIIISRFIPAIKESFEVDFVRIVSQ